jgi:hypothetical protein
VCRFLGPSAKKPTRKRSVIDLTVELFKTSYGKRKTRRCRWARMGFLIGLAGLDNLDFILHRNTGIIHPPQMPSKADVSHDLGIDNSIALA